MAERRNETRGRVLKAGSILLAGGGAIDCTVRNISGSGAALVVNNTAGIPDAFELSLATSRGRLRCEVVWRRQDRIGVRFL